MSSEHNATVLKWINVIFSKAVESKVRCYLVQFLVPWRPILPGEPSQTWASHYCIHRVPFLVYLIRIGDLFWSHYIGAVSVTRTGKIAGWGEEPSQTRGPALLRTPLQQTPPHPQADSYGYQYVSWSEWKHILVIPRVGISTVCCLNSEQWRSLFEAEKPMEKIGSCEGDVWKERLESQVDSPLSQSNLQSQCMVVILPGLRRPIALSC